MKPTSSPTCSKCRKPRVEVPEDEREALDLPERVCGCTILPRLAAIEAQGWEYLVANTEVLGTTKVPRRYEPVAIAPGPPPWLRFAPLYPTWACAVVRLNLPDRVARGVLQRLLEDPEAASTATAVYRLGGEDGLREWLFAPLAARVVCSKEDLPTEVMTPTEKRDERARARAAQRAARELDLPTPTGKS